MLKVIIFQTLLMCGIVEPMHDNNEGRELYYLYVLNEDTKEVEHVYEYAYEEEILHWLETGEFQYNEMLGGLYVDSGEDN